MSRADLRSLRAKHGPYVGDRGCGMTVWLFALRRLGAKSFHDNSRQQLHWGTSFDTAWFHKVNYSVHCPCLRLSSELHLRANDYEAAKRCIRRDQKTAQSVICLFRFMFILLGLSWSFRSLPVTQIDVELLHLVTMSANILCLHSCTACSLPRRILM